MSDSNSLALQIKNLNVDYGDGPVLRAFSGDVAATQFVSVLGASGCGKSTLLRAIAGFVSPQSGTIEIGGRLVVDGKRELVPAEKRGIGMVFQDYALFPHLDVAANIGFGVPRPQRAQRVKELLDLVDLKGFEFRRPAELSGGQQQRVALARALAPRPTLLLLDEPFANLDAKLRNDLATELRHMLQNVGAATLMVTHDRVEALALADEVIVLGTDKSGPSLCQRGSPREVYEAPATPQIAELTGCGSLRSASASGKTATTSFGQVPLVNAHEGAVSLLLRPEDLAFEPDESGYARIESRRFEGRGWKLRIQDQDGVLDLDWDHREAPAIGTPGKLRALRPLWAWPRKT